MFLTKLQIFCFCSTFFFFFFGQSLAHTTNQIFCFSLIIFLWLLLFHSVYFYDFFLLLMAIPMTSLVPRFYWTLSFSPYDISVASFAFFTSYFQLIIYFVLYDWYHLPSLLFFRHVTDTPVGFFFFFPLLIYSYLIYMVIFSRFFMSVCFF